MTQKPDKANYLQQIWLPHCLICHKDHKDLETCMGGTVTPCTEKCGKWFKPDKLDWKIKFNELRREYSFQVMDWATDFIRQTIAQQKSETIKEARRTVSDFLTKWLNDFANRPIEKRQNAFNEVAEIRKDLEDELDKLTY